MNRRKVELKGFVKSEDGRGSAAEALRLGAVTGALSGMAAVFGMAVPAEASYCDGLAPGECTAVCDVADDCDTTPPDYYHWYNQWCRSYPSGWCYMNQHLGCVCA